MINLNNTKEQITEVEWAILQAIGQYGLSQYSLIVEKAMEFLTDSKEGKIPPSRLRIGLTTLAQLQVLRREYIATPLVSRIAIYSLAAMGTHLYKQRFHAVPTLSERDRIIADHDNVEHGYGIKAIHALFEESGFFTSVCSNAKKNRIQLDAGSVYIPDIVATGEQGKYYFEYERGLHKQVNFNKKLNKAFKVTSVVNILVANMEILARMQKQVEAWIASRGGQGALTGKKIRLSTATQLKGKDPAVDGSWPCIYDMQGALPAIQENAKSQEPAEALIQQINIEEPDFIEHPAENAKPEKKLSVHHRKERGAII